MALSIIILAAGQGTRMRSALPKVLHPLAGKPLLEHVIETAHSLEADSVSVVYGHGGEQVRNALAHCDVKWVEQAEQLGTGHAVAQALPGIADRDTVLVLYGDVPLIRQYTLQRLQEAAAGGDLGLLTAQLENPHGYGRIVRNDSGDAVGIVEEKDASAQQRLITEINTGFLTAPAGALKAWVAGLGNSNAQGEYYLTDVIAAAVADGTGVDTLEPETLDEILGVNNRSQLADLERRFQRRQAEHFMAAGVGLMDPARFDLRGELHAGRDVVIDINVILEGKVQLDDDVLIGANCVIRNAHIGAGTEILPNCHIDGAVVGAGSRVGPFARLRPETTLAERIHVGNFVEIKKSAVAAGSKINHLSYIGDTTMGSGVNVGAGTITCNYDGANKHRTVIGNDVFVGSDCQFIAPVEVGDGATLGAGTTVTRDAPAGELTLSRAKQVTIKGWQRPVKKK